MWLTLTGLRTLTKQERELVNPATDSLVNAITANSQSDSKENACDLESNAIQAWTPSECDHDPLTGIDWFDQWDHEQRLWLLTQVMQSLLLDTVAPPPQAAIFDATIDAIFLTVSRHLQGVPNTIQNQHNRDLWQLRLKNAFESQTTTASLDVFDRHGARDWAALTIQIQTNIAGPSCYAQADSMRDGPRENLKKFIRGKGLPDDYLERIPPLQSDNQAKECLNRLRQLTN